MDEIERYLGKGSPFLIEVDLGSLDAVLRDVFEDGDDPPAEVVARMLTQGGDVLSVQKALSGRSPFTSAKREDLVEYVKGFFHPLVLVPFAYMGLKAGVSAARHIIVDSGLIQDHTAMLEYLELATTLIRADPWGVLLVEEIAREETTSQKNIYFRVGLEASRRLYVRYITIVRQLLDALHTDDSAPVQVSLLSILDEVTAVTPAASRRSQKAARLEPMLADIAHFTEHSEDTGGMIRWMIRWMMRHPLRALRGLVVVPRIAHVARRDPEFFSRTMAILHMMTPQALDALRGKQVPTAHDIALRVQPLARGLDALTTEGKFETSEFLAELDHIADVQRQVELGQLAHDRLAEEWVNLLKTPGVERFSALYTAFCIACGSAYERAYVASGDQRYLHSAWANFAAPLSLSSVWLAELGTRAACATRLGELYCKYGSALGLSAFDLARAIYDVYLDSVRSNERLYQRNMYWQAKVQLQASNDVAIARLAESCAFLGREEAEGAVWRQKALTIVENGKSRMLREEMALATRVPPVEVPAPLAAREESALARLREIYATLNAGQAKDYREQAVVNDYYEERSTLRLDLGGAQHAAP